MMRCMVIDDEQLVRELLEDNIRQIPFLQWAKSCKNALEAMEALQTTPVDLLFLDIQMPRVNGLQFLQALTDPPLVILVTACNRADELFRLRQNDKGTAAAELQDFFVNVEYTLVKVNVNDILFIEGVKDYIKIYLASSPRAVLTRMTLKAMEEKLPPPAFIRTHKSFLVSVRQITAVKRDIVCIGSKEIPVSVSYKANVNRVIISPS
jgi:DNA-binding LytR/AlgR family response regulator